MVCLECGRLFQALPQHVWRHGLPADDYRAKWGYNRQTGLVTPAHHETLRRLALARNLGAQVPPERIRMAQEARRRNQPPDRLEGRLAKAAAVHALHAAGRHPRRRRKVDDARLRALHGDGLTSREIAARTGVAYTTVRRRLRALGLVAPPRGRPGAQG